MIRIRPERLNLAIARQCFVACKGCYHFFGQSEPDLKAIEASVARFVRLGITSVTLSGGDPLTLGNLFEFLKSLRSIGVNDIKLDTMGTSLLKLSPASSTRQIQNERLRSLLEGINYLGLPLDGGSNNSVRLFRTGRPQIYDETVELLDAIDRHADRRLIVINTVVHRLNLGELLKILEEVSRHSAITHWNLFQYTPTDQVAEQVNRKFAIDERTFLHTCAGVLRAADNLSQERKWFGIDVQTIRSRLGQYLLINSDGESWLPDQHGHTVGLGPIAGHEEAVLTAWADAVFRIRSTAGLEESSLRPTITMWLPWEGDFPAVA
ncbi:MAG: radical SAM protein [Deltaproteobacteria bacterium]|nr:radical SAM protein [Deltaproteobacteria bacterium]